MTGAPPVDAIPPLALDAYAGTYTHQFFGDVTVREESGGLTVQIGANPDRAALEHWDRDTFRYAIADNPMSVVFTIDAQGNAEAVTVELSGSSTELPTFTRVASS